MTNLLIWKKNCFTFSYLKNLSFVLFTMLFISLNIYASVNKLWSYRQLAGFVDTSPAIGDIDNDGVKDMVFCTVAGRVLALNSLGLRMWYYDIEKDIITSPPIIADLKNDGSLEVLVLTNNGNVICLSGSSGKLIWRHKLPSPIKWGTTSLVVSDLQNNGEKEIIAADKTGNLISLKDDGSIL